MLLARWSFAVGLVFIALTVDVLLLRRRVVELVRHLLGVLEVFVAVVLDSTSTSLLDVFDDVRAEWLDRTAVVEPKLVLRRLQRLTPILAHRQCRREVTNI